MTSDRAVVDRLIREYELVLAPVSAPRSSGPGVVGDEEHPRVKRFADAYLRFTDTHLVPVQTHSEKRFEGSCPYPDHPDRNPSFFVKVNADGSLRAHCRSHSPHVRTGDFLRLLGIPEELAKATADFAPGSGGWYQDVARAGSAGAEEALEAAVRMLSAAGLEPRRTHEAVLLYDFFCPDSQADAVDHAEDSEHDDEHEDDAAARPKTFEICQTDETPKARVFVTDEGIVRLRCTCDACKGPGMVAKLRGDLGWAPKVPRTFAPSVAVVRPARPTTLVEALAARRKRVSSS